MTRLELLSTLAETVQDYQLDRDQPRTPDLIEAWLEQFPETVRDPLLEALVHVLPSTYISRARFEEFLDAIALSESIAGQASPADFWRSANLLNIQQGGSSQKEILVLFDQTLRRTHGFNLAETGSEQGDFIYLDDCVGNGSRLRRDVTDWLPTALARNIRLHVITPILFTASSRWVRDGLRDAAQAAGKTISLTNWRIESLQMENRPEFRNDCDVLWPTTLPENEDVRAYADFLSQQGYPPQLRGAGSPGTRGIFATDAQKQMLEEAFLIRGCEIRREQVNLPPSERPLGFTGLRTFGFGSMFVTYRNCPNNTPLAFWVSQDDYPALFPRKTNTETATENLLRLFR